MMHVRLPSVFIELLSDGNKSRHHILFAPYVKMSGKPKPNNVTEVAAGAPAKVPSGPGLQNKSSGLAKSSSGGAKGVAVPSGKSPEPKDLTSKVREVKVEEKTGTDDDRLAELLKKDKDFTKKYTTENKTEFEVYEKIKTLGYEIEMAKILGKGGFGVVRKGIRTKNNNQEVAIKIIDLSTEKARRKKDNRENDLRHELYVLQKVNHPNIIKLFDHFMVDQAFYIVMGELRLIQVIP